MQIYPRTNQMNMGQPVYKPAPYNDLLGEEDTEELLKNFNGGILGGFQVNTPQNIRTYGLMGGAPVNAQTAGGVRMAPQQSGQMIQPVNPSGVYDTLPNGSAPLGDGADRKAGQFNGMHIAALQDAMGRANWGNGQRPSLMDIFEAGSDGSYSLRNDGKMFNGIEWTVPNGMQGMATWADAGMSPDDAVKYWARQLSSVDNSA